MAKTPDVYFYGVAHPSAGVLGDRTNFSKFNLERIAKRLTGTPVRNHHHGDNVGRVLRAWVGDDSALHFVARVFGDGLPQRLVKQSLLDGLYNGTSLAINTATVWEGGSNGDGEIWPLGEPLEISVLPIEGAGRGPDCKIEAVLSQSDLDSATPASAAAPAVGAAGRETSSINMSSDALSGKKLMLAKAIREIRSSASDLFLDSDPQTAEKQDATNMAQVVQPAAAAVPAAPESAPAPMQVDTPQKSAPAAVQPPAPAQAPAPESGAKREEAPVVPSKLDQLNLIKELTEKLEAAKAETARLKPFADSAVRVKELEAELAKLKDQLAKSEAQKQVNTKRERVKQMARTSFPVMTQYLRDTANSLGEGDAAQDVLKGMVSWNEAKDEVKKDEVIDQLVKALPHLEMLQLASAKDLANQQKLQDETKKRIEAERKFDTAMTEAFEKSRRVLAGCEEIKGEPKMEDRLICTKRAAPELSAEQQAAEPHSKIAASKSEVLLQNLPADVPLRPTNPANPETGFWEQFNAGKIY